MKPNIAPLMTFKQIKAFTALVKTGRIRECWEYTGGKDEQGYGLFYFQNERHRAHRVSWSLMNGTIEEGKYILHKCDNPFCVNPDHLFVGTHDENMKDMKGKFRGTNGEAQPRHKLVLEQVLKIREKHQNGVKGYGKTAREYGVSSCQIWAIVNRKTWFHV